MHNPGSYAYSPELHNAWHQFHSIRASAICISLCAVHDMRLHEHFDNQDAGERENHESGAALHRDVRNHRQHLPAARRHIDKGEPIPRVGRSAGTLPPWRRQERGTPFRECPTMDAFHSNRRRHTPADGSTRVHETPARSSPRFSSRRSASSWSASM